jgi:ABC-type transporter Mla subunit MlaD
MSGMNVADTAGSPNSIFNLNWDSQASNKTIEKAAKDVSTAVDKAAQKITADVNKNSQKEIETAKAGSEKIVDAVGKIKVNNAEQPDAPSPAVKAVATGLARLGSAATEMSGYVLSHPDELGTTLDSGQAINEQLAKLIADAKKFSESANALKGTVGEVTKAADWIDSNHPSGGGSQCVPVCNVLGMPIVGSFNDLPTG